MIEEEILVQALSPERLSSYLAETNGDLSAACRLYEWNSMLSSAIFETLGDVEVIVRNSLHRELSRWSRESWGHDEWYAEATRFLHPRAAEVVVKTADLLGAMRKPVNGGSMVSHLTLGFWRYLLTKRYQTTLWPAVGVFAFPFLGAGEERNLYGKMDRLHFLRNRVAHHEPVFRRRIERDLDDCQAVLGAIHPELAMWSRSRTRVPGVLAIRPALRAESRRSG